MSKMTNMLNFKTWWEALVSGNSSTAFGNLAPTVPAARLWPLLHTRRFCIISKALSRANNLGLYSNLISQGFYREIKKKSQYLHFHIWKRFFKWLKWRVMHQWNVSEIGFCNGVFLVPEQLKILLRHLTIKRGICISNSPLYARPKRT